MLARIDAGDASLGARIADLTWRMLAVAGLVIAALRLFRGSSLELRGRGAGSPAEGRLHPPITRTGYHTRA